MTKEKEFLCNTCAQTILEEHGGIHCKCGKVYCCNYKCIDKRYLSKSISQRQNIEMCPSCEDEMLDKVIKEKEDKELQYYYGIW